MYLKSIEVQGFKSFANKITFQFHNGITGIVGPNGSGKSNVADAVRWVLGEQRIKQLRGASMQDVIFSGTELRKPLSYAYVAITLDNSDHQLAIDYDEVTVARRLYRSGESEYLLNGTICRLKDVNELFYDTGIGKEGYSIIGQGQIDKILSGKPEERRELFDEAAGIVKFKRRKAAAILKMESEKANLVRVSDILAELEKQIGPLEKQSETAKIYLKHKETLKTLDINVFLLEHKRLKKALDDVLEKYRNASAEYDESTKEYQNIKEEYESVQAQIEELDAKVEEARKILSESGLYRQRLEGEIGVLNEQINSAQASDAHLCNRKTALENEIAEHEKEKSDILNDKQDTDAKVEELAATALSMRKELEEIQNRIEELNNSIEEDKNAIMNELSQRASIKSKLGRFDTMMEQVSIRKAELNSKLLRAKSDEETRTDALKKLEETFQKLTEEIGEKNKQVQTKEAELFEIRQSLGAKDAKLREAQQNYHMQKSKLEALSNLTERYEGYGGSVKKVMEQKEKEKGIIGVVADIIKVDQKYEVAIETALGGNIQNVVTDNEETAKKMIRFLKDGKFGRVTFLPLTSIKDPQEFKNPEALKEKGVLGMADELVHVEKQYADVAKAMLGRIVVVDNVDNAVKIARKYQYGIRMVTLEGELLVPGGAISGGAFKNSSNLLSRRRELDELEKKVKEYLAEVERCGKDIEDTKARRNELRLELENLRSDIQKKSIEQNTARLSIAQSRERMEEEEEGVADLRREVKDLEEQVLEMNSGKESAAEELQKSEALEQELQEKIKLCQIELEEKRKAETESAENCAQWDLKVEKIRQAQGFKQANVDRIDGEIARAGKELQEILDAMGANAQLIEEKNANIAKIRKTIEASYDAESNSEKVLSEDTKKKEELSAKQKSFFTRREELAERNAALDKEVFRLNSSKERLEESIESHINYMWDEYEITLSAAAELRNEEMTDLPAMKREIESLKDKIRKLGNVNVNAIEDYKNLMERYTFMKTQHDDLVESQKALEALIEELDGAMRKQFLEKFAEISTEYDKVFKELFGGGKATLELQEEEDILEAGIRIIAQPPGKKLQNMMQLSGGEKALSAIALLFAIQNLKPSPFCLLDEIEAALDDSNVGRFAKYLHKLTKNTQFIVITHRRGTMEQVDRLYGITMQEKGVSTLVSVSLIDKDLTD
jgi:chromosome segregation protein